ncbi:MAG TPA: M1 family metallopeptidase [Opitutales bacterium]|nr:M1 family metallopeptidase [Opitutales bacterium]
MSKLKILRFSLWKSLILFAIAASVSNARVEKFQQIDEFLPTPNAQRTASGAPGPEYWQQQADYVIHVELDEEAKQITGSAEITYHNNSPHTLEYLWLGLDRNFFASDADTRLAPRGGEPSPTRFYYTALSRRLAEAEFDGRMNIHRVVDATGNPLPHTILKTVMRIDLPEPLESGEIYKFSIDWDFLINDGKRISTRTGYEEFDGGFVYSIAQWFPRMAAYTDYGGWQTKQYLGTGEFTLEFGNFEVHLTVPDNHVVGATGLLQNPEEVLTAAQRERLEEAAYSERPVFIVKPEEAEAARNTEANGTKTWIFYAEMVRDFAFSSSPIFVWDAMGVHGQAYEGGPVMAMALYPPEGIPLWDKYATHAVAHTIEVFSEHTFLYPYPKAIAVLGGISGGMEYPMISFNGPRPEEEDSYAGRTKYGLISIIIHETGHNFMPMIINSDERQWMWLDEGINSYLQYLAEQAWEVDYPSRRGTPERLMSYLRLRNTRDPVMTAADSLSQQGSNAYAQPVLAFNLLREVILGRELFDFALQTYAKRWMFKRPEPADFFRTMEDASGVDLDWFWRGWFYSTDRVDIAIEQVQEYQIDTRNPDIENEKARQLEEQRPRRLDQIRSADMVRRVEKYPELLDFYNEYDEYEVTDADRRRYRRLIEGLEKDGIDPALLETDKRFYLVDFRNVGGLVSPLILELGFADGSTEEVYLPAEIWRYDTRRASKLFITDKELVSVQFDPREELLDTNVENNRWPRKMIETPVQLYKPAARDNPMAESMK